jgi:hypothetical protein
MPTNLLTLETVDYADSQSNCSTVVNREPPFLEFFGLALGGNIIHQIGTPEADYPLYRPRFNHGKKTTNENVAFSMSKSILLEAAGESRLLAAVKKAPSSSFPTHFDFCSI